MRPIIRFAVSRGIHEHSQAMPGMLVGSDLDWTVVRFPRVLTGRPPGEYRTGRIKVAPWNTVRDVDVADFMLTCLRDRTSLREAPMIVSTGSDRSRPTD